ncbi:MAG: hypothetical protein HN742_42365 [Lentisphaerae bacterium]|nr:hypothetical protein [Lentisphaerota bacterium]MBT4822808.1 hypothetical protein [Lentisphaerota bacterium]MBT5605949.1 hypothetical protein [Lentisphaerota bacterium]MBT7056017.1 hypothetical protein [Lentisphaerota bacterium]MBT7848583.1 hypothetical protein [Lentisphaerota bacterium]
MQTNRYSIKIPSLKQIAPYREALACSECAVTAWKAAGARKGAPGEPAPKRIRIVQWVILDGKTQPVAKRAAGSKVRLHLEPFDMNPQLERFYLSDTLEEDFDVPLYFAADEG